MSHRIAKDASPRSRSAPGGRSTHNTSNDGSPGRIGHTADSFSRSLSPARGQRSSHEASTAQVPGAPAAAPPPPPDLFIDPVTYDIMSDPCVGSDGRTYDRSTFARLRVSPYTRLPLTMVVSNVTLRSAIWDAFPETQALYVRRPDSSYEGDIDDQGRAHGDGTRTFINGTQERGQFVAGTLYSGTKTLGSGNQDKGLFVDGVLHGEGTRTFAIGHKAGQTHTGYFERGALKQGTIACADGSRLVGSFEDGKAHGHMVLYLQNGVRNYSHYRHGVPFGMSRQVYPNGGTVSGFVGSNSMLCENVPVRGGFYSGSYVNAKRCGEGRMVYASRVVYTGPFVDDKRHGHGSMTYPDGKRYDGSFERDRKHGPGTMTFPNDPHAEKISGYYVNDKIHGIVTVPTGAQGSFCCRFENGVVVGPSLRTRPDGTTVAIEISERFVRAMNE